MDHERRDGELRDLLARAWAEHALRRVDTRVLQFPAEENHRTAVVQATVETDRGSFTALGEATDGLTAAEDRAVARALGWATNRLVPLGSASAREAQPPAEPPAAEPAAARNAPTAPADRVPAFLANQPEPDPASPAEPGEPAPVPTASQPARGVSRLHTTAETLAKACANLGLSAPEPEADWDEARLQTYVDAWSAELRRARAASGARR